MRRRRYNRGRWRLERERHQLLDGNSTSADDSENAGVRNVVTSLMRRLGMDEHLWLRELESAWPAIVGPAVAAHTRPGRYQTGLLTVFVANSAWLNELMRFGQKEMLVKLQKRFGAANIRSLRLQADPDGPDASARGSRPRPG